MRHLVLLFAILLWPGLARPVTDLIFPVLEMSAPSFSLRLQEGINHVEVISESFVYSASGMAVVSPEDELGLTASARIEVHMTSLPITVSATLGLSVPLVLRIDSYEFAAVTSVPVAVGDLIDA